MKKLAEALLLIAIVGYAGTSFPQSALFSPRLTASVRSTKQSGSRIQTIPFQSKLAGRTLPYNVLLPVDYYEPHTQTRRYPVIYLLHGLTGHYTNWLERTRLADHAVRYPLIIVMPEGNDGWYTDSATVASDRYESYLIEELIPDVEKRFRASSDRSSRAIAGLSMGGYGALKFAVKFPQTFAFAGSLSGALGAASWTEADLRGYEGIWRSLGPVFGPLDSPTRAGNDLLKLTRDLPANRIAGLPFLYIDCGTEDPLFQSNLDFASLLRSRKIPHEYRELPGGHTWNYWDAEVQEICGWPRRDLTGGRNANCQFAVAHSEAFAEHHAN